MLEERMNGIGRDEEESEGEEDEELLDI